MVAISLSGSGEGLGRAIARGYPRARSLKSAYYQRVTVNESFMSSDKRGVNSSPCMGLIHLFDQTLMSQQRQTPCTTLVSPS